MRSLKSVSTKLPDDPAEARVAIAKDVIARIRIGKLNATNHGWYIRATKKIRGTAGVNAIEAACEVCAKGAVVLSALRVFDGVIAEELRRELANADEDEFGSVGDVSLDVLGGVFDGDQLAMIETAYERGAWGDGLFLSRSMNQKCTEFGCEHDEPTDRLLAIMQNIVDHKGEFKPEVRYEIVTK